MSPSNFKDTALVLLGHGSTKIEGSASTVLHHAAELRRRGLFSEVQEAFWKQSPQISDVLARIQSPIVLIVPLFISEGFFSEEVIPRELGFRRESDEGWNRVRQDAGRTLVFCHTVGTHPRMADVILARAREIVERFPFPRAPAPAETTLLVAGHGTEQNANSRRAIEAQADIVRARGIFAEVRAVFLEEAPRIQDGLSLCQTRNVVVVPFFSSDGMHVLEDIPVLLGEPARVVNQRLQSGQPVWRNPTGRGVHLVWYTSSVGAAPELMEVVLQRAEEGWRERAKVHPPLATWHLYPDTPRGA